jgi:peroxiredoxin
VLRRSHILVVCALAALTACYNGEEPVSKGLKPVEKRNPAPDFALKDSTGTQLRLADLKGKVVLLNFWATWCGPCRTEIPMLIELEKKFRDRGFAVVGVAMDDDGWSVVKPYMEKSRINYRMILGDPSMADHYGGVDSIPQTFVIDREGRISAVHLGVIRKKEYIDEIEQLLTPAQTARNDDARGSNGAEPDQGAR